MLQFLWTWYDVCMIKEIVSKKTADDMPEMLAFIVANMATKDNIRQLDKRVGYIEQSMATKDDLKGFATKDDLKNLATKDDLKDTNWRLSDLEKSNEEMLDILRPLSKAFDKDSKKLLEHDRDISIIKRDLVMVQREIGVAV